MKYLERIQALLPLGYLYLIVLGLLKESILFYPLGINIIQYSSITDILISPISDLSSSPKLIILIALVFIILFFYQNYIITHNHLTWANKLLGQNRINPESSKREIQKALLPVFIGFIAFELFVIFIGLGVGKGITLSKRIKQNSLSANYRISSNSGKSEDIYIVELNSSYYFYLTKGNQNIKIAPIETINSLEVINNKNAK
jgi:hypothetical protein